MKEAETISNSKNDMAVTHRPTLLRVKTSAVTYFVSFGEINGIATTESPVGSAVGKLVVCIVGMSVGSVVGEVVGPNVGKGVGAMLGTVVGCIVGACVGPIVGEPVGSTVILRMEYISLQKKLTTSKGKNWKLKHFISLSLLSERRVNGNDLNGFRVICNHL